MTRPAISTDEQDASVRVYIHRLRRKLGEHYAPAPETVAIGFRFRWASIAWCWLRPMRLNKKSRRTAAATVRARCVSVVSGLFAGHRADQCLAWVYYVGRPGPDGQVCRTICGSRLPRTSADLVVMGDYYILRRVPRQLQTSPDWSRDFSINSREELDAHLMQNPTR